MLKHTILLDGLLAKLLESRSLTYPEARKVFNLLFSGKLSLAYAKAFLLLMAKKGETDGEILGCLAALRNLEKPQKTRIRSLMDTCGTGGDGRKTINVSTLAALVIAGAGGKVAKHGNRAISSKSGSSDLMEALGVRLNIPPSAVLQNIRRCGLGYFHAPLHHPVFGKMQSLRQMLKKRTILNLLGPLVNPVELDYQLVGVAEERLLPLYAKVLSKLKRKAALVCHSMDGMDEISISAPTRLAWIKRGRIRYETIDPKRYGFLHGKSSALTIRSIREGQRVSKKILSGRFRGPSRDIVVLNAGFGLAVSGRTKTVQEGIALAEKSLDSGNANQVLQKLIKATRAYDPK